MLHARVSPQTGAVVGDSRTVAVVVVVPVLVVREVWVSSVTMLVTMVEMSLYSVSTGTGAVTTVEVTPMQEHADEKRAVTSGPQAVDAQSGMVPTALLTKAGPLASVVVTVAVAVCVGRVTISTKQFQWGVGKSLFYLIGSHCGCECDKCGDAIGDIPGRVHR